MTRTLTFAQHSRLDKIADEEIGTTVVGWHPLGGPIIRRCRNGEPRTDFAAYRYVNAVGHLKPPAREHLVAAGLE